MKKKKEERKDITYHIAFDNKSVYCIAWELKMPPSSQRDKLHSKGEFFWLKIRFHKKFKETYSFRKY